jgi:hypothetical protein
MTATLYDIHTGRRRETAAAPPPPPFRRPLSATIALFAAGLAPGFLLAGVASAQGGSTMVQTELALAAGSAAVCVLAATRSRQIARRRAKRLRSRASRRATEVRASPLRRAA